MKSIDLIHVIIMVNFRTLDLNLLRVFNALMELRSVTRAGELLGLSQPAVSAALSRLRDQLGDRLFTRVGNAMVPTPRAEALERPVREFLSALEHALTVEDQFDPATAEMKITLRGADFFSMRLMPVIAARLGREAPGLWLRFLDSSRGELVNMIETGAIDLALEQPMAVPTWISTALLFQSPFVAVAARDNPVIAAAGVRPGEVLPLELFCALPHALRSIDGSDSGMTDTALAAVGRKRQVTLVLPHFDAILATVSRSRMISSVPLQLAAEISGDLGLAIYQIPIEMPVPDMTLYWHGRNDRHPGLTWFRDVLLEEVNRLWGGS